MLSLTVSTLNDDAFGNGTLESETLDGGGLSLREAIALAAPNDTIDFSGPGTLEITLGQLTLSKNVTINGLGAEQLTIHQAGSSSRVFQINSGVTATISGVTISGGNGVSIGGGIYNIGSLTLDGVTVFDNHSTQTGGGIYSVGQLSVFNSTIDANDTKYGGGIYADLNTGDMLRVENSTISNNTAADVNGSGVGGGISVAAATTGIPVDIINSTISGNSSAWSGGVRGKWYAEINIVNSTITENSAIGFATSHAGGVGGVDSTVITLNNTIVAGNSAVESGTNDAWRQHSWTINVAGSANNLIGIAGNSGFTNTNGNKVGIGTALDPGLTALGDFGGPTKTHALLTTSPAIDSGSNAKALNADGNPLVRDQRGFARDIDDPATTNANGLSTTVDMGAFEFAAPIIVSREQDEADGDYSYGNLSLREALAIAESLAGNDTIRFDPFVFADPQTILLAYDGPDSDVLPDGLVIGNDQNLTIEGPGADLLSISGDNQTRVLYISNNSNVTLKGLSIINGYATNGAGIYVDNTGQDFTFTRLQIENSEIKNNTASFGAGGGLYLVSDEDDIEADVQITLKNSTLANNTAWLGGAIEAIYEGDEGGLEVNVLNSTISGNVADGGGGAMRLGADSDAEEARAIVVNSTITDNESTLGIGGGIWAMQNLSLELHNSILANNRAPDNVTTADLAVGSLESTSSYNILGKDIVPPTGAGNIVLSPGQDPGLEPLGYFGGTTRTHELLPDSLAINVGSNAIAIGAALSKDQRGSVFQRQVGSSVDIGAVESHIVDELGTVTIYGFEDDETIKIRADEVAFGWAGGELVRAIDLESPFMINVNSLEGDDIVAVDEAFSHPLNLFGGAGDDWILGGSGQDWIDGGEGADVIYGGPNDDVLYGGLGNDMLFGDDGHDYLFGEEGIDTVRGDDGHDSLNGGPGGDVLDGGFGDDQYNGGNGLDQFELDPDDITEHAPEWITPQDIEARRGQKRVVRFLADDVEDSYGELVFGPVILIDQPADSNPGFTYTPDGTFQWYGSDKLGEYEFSAVVSDTSGQTDTATFVVDLIGSNDNPPSLPSGSAFQSMFYDHNGLLVGLPGETPDFTPEIIDLQGNDDQTLNDDLTYGGALDSDGTYTINWEEYFAEPSGDRIVISVEDDGSDSDTIQRRKRERVIYLYAETTDDALYEPVLAVDTLFQTQPGVPVEGHLGIVTPFSSIPASPEQPLLGWNGMFDISIQGGQGSIEIIDALRTGEIRYTPPADFEGLDHFTFTFDAPAIQNGSEEDLVLATSNTAHLFIEVGKAVRAELSVDGLSEEDEDVGTGSLLRVNSDDDNGNGRPDLSELLGPVLGEDDLVKVDVDYWLRNDAYVDDFKAYFTASGGIRIWTTSDKETEILTGDEFDVTELPEEVFVEGLLLGMDTLRLDVRTHANSSDPLFTGIATSVDGFASTSDSDTIHFTGTANGWFIDLDIDSDNNNAFGQPDGSVWEEELEVNPYGLGKLIMLDNANRPVTPVVLRLNPGLDPEDPSIRIRLDWDVVGPAGWVSIWDTPVIDTLRNPDAVDEGGNRVFSGIAYTLDDLNYDTGTGEIVLYLEGTRENQLIKTLAGVEEWGKPDERIRATIVRNGADVTSDEAKYLVANEDSFFYHLQTREEVRNAIASNGAYSLSDMPQFSLQDLSPQDLLELGVPRDIVMLIGAGSGVPGFAATLYQDFISGPAEYVLAFAGTDDIPDWINNIWQASGWLAPQYTVAMSTAFALSTMVPAIPTGNLVTTGHSLGGGLASAAATVADNILADTFNAAGLNALTLFEPDGSGGYEEIYAGSVNRYLNASSLIDAFYVDWDLLSLVQDNTDLPIALGNRVLMDGPYDSEVLLGIPTVISEGFENVETWEEVASIVGTRLFTLYKSHRVPAVLYGLLVDLSGVDVYGYDL